ncbi:MAG: DUF1566 domain-containing protein [Colwellia sp.]|nr:DUF1566 domain-containing protein [Colwellia sp.]
MSDDAKDKRDREEIIKEKELEKADEELARIKEDRKRIKEDRKRIEEDRKRIEFERKEKERKFHLCWYKKPKVIQTFVASILWMPLIWFYVKDVALPLSRGENIRLTRELTKERENFDEMEFKHKIEAKGYIDIIRKLRTNNENIKSIDQSLAKINGESANKNNPYADEIQNLMMQKAEIEEQNNIALEKIKNKVKLPKARKPSEYLTQKDTMLLLYQVFRLQTYTENKFEVKLINNNKVIVDHATGLTWQQSGSDVYMNYSQANTYIVSLNRDQFAGYNDWRLPTLEETITLIEQEKNSNELFVDSEFGKEQKWIWTSDKSSVSSAWVIYFVYGYCGYCDLSLNDCYVRAVR